LVTSLSLFTYLQEGNDDGQGFKMPWDKKPITIEEIGPGQAEQHQPSGRMNMRTRLVSSKEKEKWT
jgi:hypothetical protein